MTQESNTEPQDISGSAQTKVPVFATVGRAYSYVFANIAQVLLCLVQVAIISGIPTILISRTFPTVISSVLTTVWSTATVAPFAVMVHRAILLGEPLDARRYIPTFRDPRVTKFIIVGLTIYAVPLLLQVASALLIETSLLLSGLLSIAYLIATFYVLRYMLAFPAIATDRYTDLSDSHALLEGSIVRVFLAMVVAILPIIVVVGIFAQGAVSETGEVSPWLYLPGLILMPVFPAILSFAYMDRRNNVGRASESGPRESN